MVVVASRVAVAASGTLTVLLTSRILAPRGRGEFADMQAAAMLVGNVGSASIWLGISLKTAQEQSAAREASSLAVLWALPLALPAAIVAVTAVPPARHSATAAMAVVLTSMAVSTYGILQGIPIGLARMRDFARADIWRAALTFGFVAAALGVVRDPAVLIMMLGFGFAIGSCVLLLRVREALPLRFPRWREFVRPVLNNSLRAHPANTLGLAVLRLDIMVMALVAAPAQVAFYSLAVAFSEGVWLAPGAIGVVNLSDIANLSLTDARRATQRRIRLSLSIGAATALVIGVAGTILIEIALSPAYRNSIGPLWISLAGAVAYSLCHAISPYVIVALKRTELMSVITALTLVINIGALLLLVPEMGVSGASLASSIAYGFAAFATTTYYLKARSI